MISSLQFIQPSVIESSGGIRPTLNIFPSQPMQVEPSTKLWQLGEEEKENEEFHLEPSKKETIDFVSTSKRPSEISMELAHPKNDPATVPQPGRDAKCQVNQKGSNF